MNRESIVRVFIAVVIVIAGSGPAFAITHGEPDGDDHPYVGLLIFDVGGSPAWRCTGTLLNPSVMLTAGHCTFGATGGRVWFESDVDSAPGTNYPLGGGTAIEFAAIFSHPDYEDSNFALHDLGVVILQQPVNLPTYGALPQAGLLDGLATQRGLQEQIFNPVGYGLQSVRPGFQSDRVRYSAQVHLVSVRGTAGVPAGEAVLFTNNPGRPASGGTCFGDSGGPIFWGESNVIVAVTSFSLNQNCKGTSGGHRIDTEEDLALFDFLP